jgi:hypothetical protein
MTAPNIVDVGTITGKTNYFALSSTNATVIATNTASSGKVFKVNSLVVANVDGATAADITITVNSADDGAGTAYALAKTISVPADASLIVIDKSTAVYLEEDRSIVATAGSANDLEIVISYEEIS